MKIFAKHGTSQKVIVNCTKLNILDTMVRLNNLYGGSWVFVEELNFTEGLFFDDAMPYKGFGGPTENERYSKGIKPLFEI